MTMNRILSRLLLPVLAAALLTSAAALAIPAAATTAGARSAADASTPSPCGPTWTQTAAASDAPYGQSELLGVTRTPGGTIWAVGDTHSGGIALIEKLTASGWVRVPGHVPGVSTLGGVAAASDHDVWAVGTHGNPLGTSSPLIDHWNGSRWSLVSSPAVAQGSLDAVAALGPDDVWAVGTQDGELHTLTEHFNGKSWSVVPSLDHAPVANILTGVSGTSADAVWAVGPGEGGPMVEYWDGTDWRLVTTPSKAPTPLAVAALSPSDVWAVGGSNQLGSDTMNWNGSRWNQVPAPELGGRLTGLAAAGPRDVWVSTGLSGGGQSILTANWNGRAWQATLTPRLTTEGQTNAITTLPGGGALAVGWAGSTLTKTHGAVWQVCPVQVTGGQFQPAAATDAGWLTMVWRAAAANGHSITLRDDTGLGLFKSGSMAPGATYSFRFYAAGTYSVAQASGPARQRVGVPLSAGPVPSEANTYQLTWAARGAPFGYVYDVRMKAPGASQFTPFRTGVSSVTATATLSAAGTYQFEARERKSPGGAVSGWSPPVSVTVTG
jgi:hypothetical protein